MSIEYFFLTTGHDIVRGVISEGIRWLFSQVKQPCKPEIERTVEAYLQNRFSPMVIKEVVYVVEDVFSHERSDNRHLPRTTTPPDLGERLDQSIHNWWSTRRYAILSQISEKALDLPKWEGNHWMPIQQYEYHGGENQQWKFIPAGKSPDVFKIHCVHGAKVLDVLEWGQKNGDAIGVYPYHGGDNQHWRLAPVEGSEDIFNITSLHSGMSLDVKDKELKDGATIIQFHYYGGVNQQWRLLRVK
ncbi:MAG TPA: RICIN domain-containing protein [Methylomirabilota bacterium]|nr:RICIN domain-containing protein [Methylomirabilota bacterium]